MEIKEESHILKQKCVLAVTKKNVETIQIAQNNAERAMLSITTREIIKLKQLPRLDGLKIGQLKWNYITRSDESK